MSVLRRYGWLAVVLFTIKGLATTALIAWTLLG